MDVTTVTRRDVEVAWGCLGGTIIFGIGGLAQVVAWYMDNVVAFTVDKEYIKEDELMDMPIVPFEEVEKLRPPSIYDMFVAVTQQNRHRHLLEQKCEEAIEKGYNLTWWISAGAIAPREITPGANILISPGAIVERNARVSRGVFVRSGAYIGHDTTLSEYAYIAPRACIGGNVGWCYGRGWCNYRRRSGGAQRRGPRHCHQSLFLHPAPYLCGGRQYMKTLHVGRPNLPNEELFLSLVDEIWESVWLTNDGPLVQLFEERLAEFLGVRHVIAVANATLGLEILVHALDMTKDVIMPAFTFVATPHAVSWCGGRPVFADIAPGTFSIDPDHVESLITNRTSGIIGVHTFGHPCDVAPLQDIADRYKVPLIFDAAHAFGCTYKGTTIGSFGDAEVFSFHATNR